MDDLEEAEVHRQPLPRDAAMRPRPGARRRPWALGRADARLAGAVAVPVASALAAPVADGLVAVAPGFQAGVDVALVGVDQGARGDGRLDDGPDGGPPDVGRHPDDRVAAAPERARDRRLLLLRRAAPGRGPQPAASAGAPLSATASGPPLRPATTWTSSISTSPSSRAGGVLAVSPCRGRSVMARTSEAPRSGSRAICRLERSRPMRCRRSAQTRSGRWRPASAAPVRSSRRLPHPAQR
jgi:hypothetical protein